METTRNCCKHCYHFIAMHALPLKLVLFITLFQSYNSGNNMNNLSSHSFLSLNARSLFNKMDELRTLVVNASPSPLIIGISESWANSCEPDSFYSIPGYSLHRVDRVNQVGGGVMLYIQNNTPHEVLKFRSDPAVCESIWLSVKLPSITLAVASIYKPPRTDDGLFCRLLERNISEARSSADHILLLGDFNAKHNSWYTNDQTDALGERLQCLFASYNLHQSVSFPTCLHQGYLKSCLDLVISSLDPHKVSVRNTAPLGGGDHVVLDGRISLLSDPITCSIPEPNQIRWNWSEDSIASLRKGLSNCQFAASNIPPDCTAPQEEVTRLWNDWRSNVIRISQQCCQSYRPPSRSQPRHGPSRPWVTQPLISQIKRKHFLFRQYLQCRTEAKWQAFTEQRNKVTSLLRRAKSDFVTSSSGDFHKHRLHTVLRHLRKTQASAIPDLMSAGDRLTTAEAKAEALNQFFIQQSQQSVSDEDNVPSMHASPSLATSESLHHFSTDVEEVATLLRHLDHTKSPGCDGVSTRVLKEGAAELAPSLTALFNFSLSHCVLPQDWKDATITPLFKKGDPHLSTNYRPISLLSVVSKVLERIVHKRLYKHIEHYLPPNQSGFRQNDGTEHQLARLIHEISARRDEGQAVIACFFDLSKAFDRVWHEGLLAKLKHYRVTGSALSWLTSYLTGRRQRVQVGGEMSQWLRVPAGVPQGSVLGPLLFLAYTIDLPKACTNDTTSCSQFADDTALIACGESHQDAHRSLQQAVTAAGTWLKNWHLLVNTDKTVVMIFHHTNRPPPPLPAITLNSKPLKVVSKQRHLGMILQQTLRWSAHLDHVITKANKSLFQLRRLRSKINPSALVYLYTTYIRPILEYGSTVATPLSVTLCDRLERYQRRAARVCLGIPLFSPVDHSLLLHKIELPSLFSRRIVKHVLFTHSISYNYAPPHLLGLQLTSHQPAYSLRHTRMYNIPTTRTDRHRDSPVNIALQYFNLLPQSISSIPDRSAFKNAAAALLINSICPCSAHPISYHC